MCCLTIQQESRENTEQNNSFYNHVCATETNCGSSTPHIQRHFTEETLQVLHPFSSARPDQGGDKVYPSNISSSPKYKSLY